MRTSPSAGRASICSRDVPEMSAGGAEGPVGVWVEAARPRTLGAGVVPVLVGTAAAESFSLWRFACALLVGVALQVGVNYANDYSDGTKGVDSSARVGPRRAVASGLVSPAAMRTAMWMAFAVAGIAGAILAVAVEPWILAAGVVCFAAALGYSGGPKPYASAALGEVFVFVFFGLVATVGSFYVQTERISVVSLAASAPVGVLAVAILVTNNLRDIETDEAAAKRTLAVRLGAPRTRSFFTALLMIAIVSGAGVALAARSPWPLLALVSLPAIFGAYRAVTGARSATDLLPALGATARAHLSFGLLVAVGLFLA